MRRSNTQSIGEVIGEFVKQHNLEKKLKETKVISQWEEIIGSWENIIGKTVARATTKMFFKEKTLYVYLNSSVVRNELVMIRAGIIKRINDISGEEIVTELVLR